MEMHLGGHVSFLFFMRKNGMQVVPQLMSNITAYGVPLRLTTVLISCGATAQHLKVGLLPLHLMLPVQVATCPSSKSKLIYILTIKHWLPYINGQLCFFAGTFWSKHPLTNVYYQVNERSALTWYQARKSCQQQGAELLSVSESHEHTFIAGTVPLKRHSD